MSFWLKKLLYSFRALPILFAVIISLLSIRLLLVFTGVIHHKAMLPIGEVEAAERQINEAQQTQKTESQKKEVPQKEIGPKESEKKDPEKKDSGQKEAAKTDPMKNEVDKKEDINKKTDLQNNKADSSSEELSDVEDEDEFSPEKIALLTKLKERNLSLAQQEERLKEKSEILKTVEHKIEEKYKELDQKRLDLEKVKSEATELTKQLAEEDEKKLQSLVKIYQSMKPKDAARIFDHLDMRVLLDVMRRMKEANAGTILANMDPERAKNVTLFLAEKKKAPKVEG